MFTGFLHPKLSPERSLDWSAGVLDRGWRGLAEDGRRRRAGRGGEQTLWSFGRPPPPASAPVGGSGEIRWPRVGRTDGHRCVLAACPRAWDCAGFAGGAFLAPNDRRRGEAVGSPVCPARKPAFPGCETAPPWRTQARRACYRWSSTRPWCFTPSLRRLRLSLWTSGAGWPHDGVLKRALGRYCASLIFT
jgi:hypothetical protein